MGKRLTIESFMTPFPGSILREQDELVREQLRTRFGKHEDFDIIMDVFEEWGPEALLHVINTNYDPNFAI